MVSRFIFKPGIMSYRWHHLCFATISGWDTFLTLLSSILILYISSSLYSQHHVVNSISIYIIVNSARLNHVRGPFFLLNCGVGCTVALPGICTHVNQDLKSSHACAALSPLSLEFFLWKGEPTDPLRLKFRTRDLLLLPYGYWWLSRDTVLNKRKSHGDSLAFPFSLGRSWRMWANSTKALLRKWARARFPRKGAV